MRLNLKLRRKDSPFSFPYAFCVTLLSCLLLAELTLADNNCFVSNCEQDEDPCAEQPDKNVAIYRERCRMGKGAASREGTIAICCRPNSDEGMLMTAYGAEPHEFPHMVHVQDNCGGTLYNRRFVLTAAHCVTEMALGSTEKNKTFFYETPIPHEKVFVRVGSNIKTAGEKIKAEQVTIHPFYSSLLENLKTDEDKVSRNRPILYDVAVIKLAKEVHISDAVRTLKLADRDFMPAKHSKRAVMLGWGTTDDLKTWFGTYYLQKVNSPIRSDRECPIWETDPYPKHKDKLICVGGYVDDDYAPTAGPGDSGGPLICKDSFSRAVLCGIASFAGSPKDCAKRIKNARCYPNAFSSIPYYYDWIVNITGPQDEKDFYRPILNGEASTKDTEFPHEVYINSTDGTACGGTLITQEVVLTAAHCVMDDQNNFRVDLTIYAGLNGATGDKHVQTFFVDLVHGPPKFRKRWDKWIEENSTLIISDRAHFYDDIILLQLDRPIIETKYVSTLPWAAQESELKDEGLEPSWKISKSGMPFIQKRKFNLLSNDECQERLDRVLPVRNLPLASSSYCAVEQYSGGSSCDRTTGGPILCTSRSKRETYVCGIQSFRFCSYAFPNVITNVAKFSDWIDDGLDRMEKQREFDEMYGNGYDYDYYGAAPPPQRGGPQTRRPLGPDPNGRFDELDGQIPPPPIQMPPGRREMQLPVPPSSRRRQRPRYSGEAGGTSEEREDEEEEVSRERLPPALRRRLRPEPRRFGDYYSESYRPRD